MGVKFGMSGKPCPGQAGRGSGAPVGLALDGGSVGCGQAVHGPRRKVRCTGTDTE